MKLTITNALYIAGAILLGSAIISQFERAELITSTVLVLISVVILYQGYKKDEEKLKACLTNTSKKKRGKVVLWISLLLIALGFAIGKLIYLWSH